jgi:hypothetical protein
MTRASEGSLQPGLRFARDEEAPGSNPVTRSVFPQAKGPSSSGLAFGVAGTATKYRNGAHRRDSPSLRSASLVAVELAVA